MRRTLMTSCAVAVATAVAATGCVGGGGGGDRKAPEQGPRPAALTWQQELRISDALQHLIARCMKSQGFTYWVERELSLQESRPVRYVQDDVAWARKHGYGGRIGAKNQRILERNPIGTYRQKLSPTRRAAFDVALDGGDEARTLRAPLPKGGEIQKRSGGCTEKAERTLYGDPETWFRTSKTVMSLNGLYAKDLMTDRQLTSALAEWERCMKRAGQPYKDPQDARDAASLRTARLGAARADEAFAAERRTAVADATCARQNSLRAVAAAREDHYTDRLRDRYGEDIDTHRRLGRQAHDRAVRIVPERD